MSVVEDIVVPIAVVSGMGAAIDFYLGSAGQKRVKSWLEEKWYRFHEVNWHNFSKKEAGYFIEFADRAFGASLVSRRRVEVCLSIAGLATVLFTLVSLWYGFGLPEFGLGFVLNLLIDAVVLAISLSLTGFMSSVVVRLSSVSIAGPSLFFFLFAFHYVLLAWWRPVIEYSVVANLKILVNVLEILRWTGELQLYLFNTANPLRGTSLTPTSIFESCAHLINIKNHYIYPGGSPFLGADVASYISTARAALLSLLANGIRLLFALALLLSFLGRAWIGPVFSTVWARLVETDKPVFTIVFGAIGAIATAIKEIVKLLPSS